MDQYIGDAAQGRPRRRRRRPGENRAALLEAAAAVFSRHGYHRASTSLIAASAEIPQPHVYVHFSTKADLFLAALEHSYGFVTAPEGHAVERSDATPVEPARAAPWDQRARLMALMHFQAVAAMGDGGLGDRVRSIVTAQIESLGEGWHRQCLVVAADQLLSGVLE